MTPQNIADVLVKIMFTTMAYYFLKWSYKLLSWYSARRQRKKEAKARRILEKAGKAHSA